mgnify:CR=1 FL=1
MAREEITLITCDRCGAEDDVNSTSEGTVNSKMEGRGWLVTEDEDICPTCKELDEIEEDEEDD